VWYTENSEIVDSVSIAFLLFNSQIDFAPDVTASGVFRFDFRNPKPVWLKGSPMPAHGSYKVSDAAKAAGVPVKTVSRDIDRGVIEIPGPDPGKGHRHLLAPPTVYRIAIGYALTKLSVTPKQVVPVESFTQSSRQQAIEIISFGIWSESENAVAPARSRSKRR
jgi:hypothetical protein